MSIKLTEEERKFLRENSSMKAFMFYLDNFTKLEVMEKLKEKGLDTKKGTLSALIRVLLKYFADLIDDDPTLEYLVEKVKEEYVFTTKKNKRSAM